MTALNTVEITGSFNDGSGTPLSGTITFTPSATVRAGGVPVLQPDVPVQASIVAGQLQAASGGTLSLVATDNSGLSIEGLTGWWAWQVQATIGGEAQDAWSFFLPYESLGAGPIDLYSLANTPASGGSFLPLPSGSPSVGNVPVVTDASPLALDWGSGGGGGGVSTVSVVTANGFAGTVATATSTPAITMQTTVTGLLKGNGTAVTAATAGTDYLTPSGSGASLTGITATQVGALPSTDDLSAIASANATAANWSNNSRKITSLGAATASTDAAQLGQVGVTSVTAGDTSIVVGGSASAPTIETGTLDVIASDHPPAANWSNNSKKITSLLNGSAAQDAAAYGQTPAGGNTATIGQGGTGQVTQQAAINALTGSQSAGKYLRSDGTNASLQTLQAGDVPTLNQSTTGNAATATNLAGAAAFPAEVSPKVATLTDAASVAVNAALANDYRLTFTTAVGSSRTIAVPTGATDGQKLIFELIQPASGGPCTAVWPGPVTAPNAPTLATATTGGTVLAGTYQVEVTYVNALGETTASISASQVTTGSTSTLTITSPAASNSATGWYAYVTQAGGSTYYRQQGSGSPTAIGTNLTLTAPPTTSGANPPGSNTTGTGGFNFGSSTYPQLSTGATQIDQVGFRYSAVSERYATSAGQWLFTGSDGAF